MTDPVIPEAYLRADALIRDLTADPELGAKVRAKVKERFTDVAFVEDRIDPAVSRVEASLAEERAKREALEAAIAKRDEDAANAQRSSAMEAALAGARSKFNLTDHGFDLMVQRMKDTGNYNDAEAAAAWSAAQNPKVAEPSKAYLGPQNANFYGSAVADEKYRLLHSDPMGKFLDSEFADFVSDPDAYVREALGQ